MKLIVKNVQPKPTIEQLMTWATPRLLRYYKSERQKEIRLRPQYDWGMTDVEQLELDLQKEYVANIKSELDTREHVER